ncbi:hypothetical protein [Paraflavitalea speifideaquila]|nr:hypothetical protein [Paraflavitalea speifideiaquila]
MAASIYSTVSLPAFEQSAMDGYAFHYEGWGKKPLSIVGRWRQGLPPLFQ